MNKFYILLRAVNVGGKNIIQMKEFVAYLSDIGFKNISTYIQSGNIILNTKDFSKVEVANLVKRCIYNQYGYDISVYVLTNDDLIEIKNNNPFQGEDVKKLYYAFLSDKATEENIKKLSEFNVGEDEYIIANNIVYIYYKTSAGQSKLNNSLIERKLKVNSTMRNFNTLNKLIEK